MTGFGTGQAAPPPHPRSGEQSALAGAVTPAVTAPAAPVAGPVGVARARVAPAAARLATRESGGVGGLGVAGGGPDPAVTTRQLAALGRPAPVPPPGRPESPVPRPRPRVVLPVVVAELVLVVVLLVLDRSWPVVAAVAGCAALLGAFVAVRVRGRLLCQWLLLAIRFLLRPRTVDLPAEDTGAAVLALLRPGATGTQTMIGDAPAFLVSDEAGVGTVLRPEAHRREPGPPTLSPRELLPDSDEQALAYAVQVIHHVSVDRSQPPRVWLTLRAARTAEVYADDDVRAALANVVRRVRRRLRRAGVPFRPLTESETVASYAALAHVNAGRHRVREEWWQWHSGPIRQATFRLDGWAALSQPAAARLVRWLLAAAPDTAVTVSSVAQHDPTEPGGAPVVAAVLRIATTQPAALAAAETDVAQLAKEVGVTLNRLDGQHVHGVTATLPLGIGYGAIR